MRNRELQPKGTREIEVCTTCTEPVCDGGFKGCPYSKEFGLKHKPVYLMQISCGFPDPEQLAIRNKEKNRRNYDLRKKRARQTVRMVHTR